jgi:3-keto-L-gulonate-6-phosphate decarboxylase
MILYISFNDLDLTKALATAQQVEPFCHGFKIGPVLLMRYGIQAVTQFRVAFPNKKIICDTQIIDHEKELVALINQVNGNAVTVLAESYPTAIRHACIMAQQKNIEVILDLAGSSLFGQRILEAKTLGVNAIIMRYFGETETMDLFIDRWDMVYGNTQLPVFIATAITRESIGPILALNPAGFIIGGAITESADPVAEATYFYRLMS